MMMPKGELANRAQGHKIDWFSLVCFGAAEKMPFVNVEFITLQQHCVDLIIPEAIEFCAEENLDGNQDEMIKAYVKDHNDQMMLKEFVSCFLSDHDNTLYVTVGLNVSRIDDEAEKYGLELLSQVEHFGPGVYQEFGKGYYYTPWMGIEGVVK